MTHPVDRIGDKPVTNEELFDEAQAIMGALPSNIGSAKTAGRLTVGQLAKLERLAEVERLLPPNGPEWQRIWKAHREKYDADLKVQRDEFGTTQRAKAEASGFKVGDRVSYYAPSFIPTAPGTKHSGVVKQSVNGMVYVSSRGARFDLFRNPWSVD